MKFTPQIARDERHDARDMIDRLDTHLAGRHQRGITGGARFKISAARGTLGQHGFRWLASLAPRPHDKITQRCRCVPMISD